MLDALSPGTDDHPAPEAAAVRPQGPGALRGEVSLTLNTLQALHLFAGRPATEGGPFPIPGLYRFANYVDQISIGSGSGDPYADWTLMRVERLMDGCEQLIIDLDNDVRAKLKAARGLDITVAHSQSPKVIDLQLTSPYAHWAARLIGEYDAFMAATLSARYVGILDEETVSTMIADCSRAFRRAIQTAQAYRFTGVTREDIAQKTARALEVVEKHGEPPEEILMDTFRPRFRYQAKSH